MAPQVAVGAAVGIVSVAIVMLVDEGPAPK